MYGDGGDFLEIWDIREKHQKKFILSAEERDVYLYCETARSLDDIAARFDTLTKKQIQDMLSEFDAFKLMFSEGDVYLSLAVKMRSRANDAAQ